MADFRTIWRADRFIGDFEVGAAGLSTGCDLTTAILISLFTHRRAHADDRLPDQAGGDRRGWWADALLERPIGSRLWLLSREKQMPEVMRRAEDYAREALAWLISDGLAALVGVTASAPQPGVLALALAIRRPQGQTDRIEIAGPWAGLAACAGMSVAENGGPARFFAPQTLQEELLS